MNPQSDNQTRVEERDAQLDYQSGQAYGLLLEFQQKRVTGIVRLEARSENVANKSLFVFQDGLIVYAGKKLPSPAEFLTEISHYTEAKIIREVVEFAAKRSSIQKVLQTLVKLDVMSWPGIADAVCLQIRSVLSRLRETVGRAYLDPNAASFELQYENGISGFALDELLIGIEQPSQGMDMRPIILSVDDSPIARTMVGRYLGKDYQVISCENAADAMTVLDRQHREIKLLLLDLTLPGMDGLYFCKVIRKWFPDLPIIILTARGGITDRLRGHLSGVNGYLTKPCLPKELSASVAREIARSRLMSG